MASPSSPSRSQQQLAADFLALHQPGQPLLMPNPYDAGSARVLAGSGFSALATTSAGFAATIGRRDHKVSREEALSGGASIAAAVGVPVSADLENGFADDPAGVAATIAGALDAGLAGCSIEDATGRSDQALYEIGVATERIAAAAEAAHAGPVRLVLTARAEGFLFPDPDLGDVIRRLQSFQEAGADVLFAPGITDLATIKTVVSEVDRPVNVLVLPGSPTIAVLAAAGVARISVGGAFTWVALGALQTAAEQLLKGSYAFFDAAGRGREVVGQAFTD
jgi:2-methylisocitrate lyase-like PEP mutase family enzyme